MQQVNSEGTVSYTNFMGASRWERVRKLLNHLNFHILWSGRKRWWEWREQSDHRGCGSRKTDAGCRWEQLIKIGITIYDMSWKTHKQDIYVCVTHLKMRFRKNRRNKTPPFSHPVPGGLYPRICRWVNLGDCNWVPPNKILLCNLLLLIKFLA